MAEGNEHFARITQFRSDLRALRPTEIVRKYITTGT